MKFRLVEDVEKNMVKASNIISEENVKEYIYKDKRGSLADVIQDELTDGEIVYYDNNGKLSPTSTVGLGIDYMDIGPATEDDGYLSIKVEPDMVDAVIEIAKKYDRDYEVKGNVGTRGSKTKEVIIKTSESDWVGNYVDPRVKTRKQVSKERK